MTGDHDRALKPRLAELEATVRGLTQELVSAEERIRQLEAALEDEAIDDAGATKPSPEGTEAESDAASSETGSDLDDIIVA